MVYSFRLFVGFNPPEKVELARRVTHTITVTHLAFTQLILNHLKIPIPFILIIITQNRIPSLEAELKRPDLMVVLEYSISLCCILISCSYHACLVRVNSE